MTNVPRAYEITVTACEHGLVHVCFKDKHGELIATASMDLEQGFEFLRQYRVACEEALAISQSHAAAAAGQQH
jgi:hypothetical protein